jgi:RNA polymerase sigma factor (sigma-70 family)
MAQHAGGAREGGRDLERRAIRAAKAGDWDGLQYLYSRYADDVLKFVQSIVRNRHDAEDVTHEVFAKLMRAIQRYEEREVPFAAWILRVARNAALDHLRSRRQIPVEEVRIGENGHPQTSFEDLDAFKTALAACPSRNARYSSCGISAASRRTKSPKGWGRPRRQSRGCTTGGAQR